MRRTIQTLLLLTLPFVAGASVASEPARKEYLMVTVRADSGAAQRFTVEADGFHVFASRGKRLAAASQAGDTISVVGSGSAKILSSEPGKPLSVDVWMWSQYRSEPVRYTGTTIRIDRASFVTAYQVTTP